MSQTRPTKRCPYCAEEILAEAIVCRFCGRDLRQSVYAYAPQALPVMPPRSEGGIGRGCLIVLGLVAILCIGGLTFVAALSLATNNSNPYDFLTPSARTAAQPDTQATRTPTPAPLGESRDNPIPLGTVVTVGDLDIGVIDAVRPADSIVQAANMFNIEPESNQEYAMVEVSATCNAERCFLWLFDFKMVGDAGILYDAELFVSGIEGLLIDTEFLRGATTGGKMFFLVQRGEMGVVLQYDQGFDFEVPRYFAVQ